VHNRWHPLFDGDAKEQNAADVVQLVSAEEDGISLGPGGHNGASGSKHIETGLQDS
jgi:hypothetical protein